MESHPLRRDAVSRRKNGPCRNHDNGVPWAHTLQWPRKSKQKQTSLARCMNKCNSAKTPQTEFALIRESFGVSRANHTQRVHGRLILEDDGAAKT